MPKLSREMRLESDAFAKMDRLRFLEFRGGISGGISVINKVHLPSSGLEYLSDELRYLRWDGFPSKSLPQNFCAEYLFELNLEESKVEKLWSGVQDLVNLREINLARCECLRELPDLSKANNLEILDLGGCKRLIEVPSSLQCLEKLEELDLWGCYSLRSVPSRFDSKVLRALSITGRPEMSKCPEIISGNMKWLDLSETSISEVPGSITSTLEPMTSLRHLDLRGTGIKELPSSIKHLVSLTTLSIDGTPIRWLPELPSRLYELTACDCASLETISIINLLGDFNFASCFKLDQKALIAYMQLKIQFGQIQDYRYIEMVLPGSKIPEWFSEVGSSVTIPFPTNCHQLIKGVAFCLVFRNLKVKNGSVKDPIGLGIHIEAKNGEHDEYIYGETRLHKISPESDHMLLMCANRVFQNKYSGEEVTFKFGGLILVKAEERGGLDPKWVETEGLERCGVYLHFDENLPRKQYFR